MTVRFDGLRRLALSAVATTSLILFANTAHAQTFPNQPVIIENRPGAGGQIGSQVVAKAAPDGHTLLVQSSSHAANPAIYKKLPYDPTQDLIDVALLATAPYVMLGAAQGPYKSVKDIVAAAKAKPKGEPFASAGIGTSTHLTAEMFCQQAGIQMIHVPFKGSPAAIVAKLSADNTAAIQSAEVQEQYKKSGNDSQLMTPTEFATFVRSEMELNKTSVRQAGIQPE